MRQSSTYTTRSLGENGCQIITRHKLPMTRGRAIIEARSSFGPSAHVQVRGRELVVLLNGELLGSGLSWRSALREAAKGRP